jgi:hypothetical protein
VADRIEVPHSGGSVVKPAAEARVLIAVPRQRLLNRKESHTLLRAKGSQFCLDWFNIDANRRRIDYD